MELSLTKRQRKTIKCAHQTKKIMQMSILSMLTPMVISRLHNSIDNKYAYEFKSKEELDELFHKFDLEIPELHNQI